MNAPQMRIAPHPRTYGRLGYRADVDRAIALVLPLGALVKEDSEAETVEAKTPLGEVVFRALHKGGGVWIVMYNPEFWGPA